MNPNKNNILSSFILLAVCSLLLTNCVKLKETPPGQLSPGNFYKTTADFDAAIIGVYQPLHQGYSAFDFNAPFILCYGAEDCTTRPQATDSKLYDELKPSSSSSALNNCWDMCYNAINNADAILGHLKTTQGISQTQLDAYEGQVKFVRALSYFFLTRWFGKVPIITEANQATASTTPEDSVSNIYKLIVQDLLDADAKLPVSFPEGGKATKGAAKALLAKVYLTMAGWPLLDNTNYALARDKAKEVMDMGVYKLVANFSDLWHAKNKFTNGEFIFTLSGISTASWIQGSHHHVATRPGAEGGWSDMFTEARFLNVFPAGPRKDASFHTVFEDGTQWQNGPFQQPYISKYRDAGAAAGFTGAIVKNDGDGATCLLRYADVLLIYAEAANMAEGGPSASALESINKVRRRANGKDPNTPDAASDLPGGLSQATFDQDVLDERNWELAFELNRWFDLVRRQLVVSVNKDLYPYVDAHNMLLPKPASEIALLKGLLNQNLGY
ncbi:RagB/SusD family nutrient uptake outer membrane protein [Flavitalea flava]